MRWHSIWADPPEKLLGGGLSTPVPPFCLFCTIISNKTCILDWYQNCPRSYQPGPPWLPGSTPSIFQEAFRADSTRGDVPHEAMFHMSRYFIWADVSYEPIFYMPIDCKVHSMADCATLVMAHIWMSHVTHMNESCHICEWGISHIWMSHVTHLNEWCHTYESIMSHTLCTWIPTNRNESCPTYERKHHATHMNASCHK